MLQQEAPQDYVIAAGQQVSVRDFPIHAASQLDIKLAFEGNSADEVACVAQVTNATTAALSLGDVVVRIDPRYFGPAEVEALLVDPSKAQRELGWKPKTAWQAMCSEMVSNDLEVTRRRARLRVLAAEDASKRA